jgi:GT2 family glycosyltransferase
VSIVVPVHRAGGTLRACLESLRALQPAALEIVVVIDGGGPEGADVARECGARVVALPTNRGPAAARNAGVRETTGDLVFFVDADVVVPPDTIARLLATFEAHPDIDAVIGSYDDRPGAANFFSQYKNLAHHFVHQTSHDETFSFWSACGAVRRTCFDRVGGFDERYTRPSIEDIELGSRLQSAGCRLRLEKTLQVTHLKRWTFLRLMQCEIRDRAVPWTRLILRSHRMPDDLNLRWRGRIAVACASLLTVALVLAPWWPWALAGVAVLAVALVLIDRQVFGFFRSRRGAGFAARAIVAHWMHYLCCAVGLVGGMVAHVAGGRARVAAPAPLEKGAGRA